MELKGPFGFDGHETMVDCLTRWNTFQSHNTTVVRFGMTIPSRSFAARYCNIKAECHLVDTLTPKLVRVCTHTVGQNAAGGLYVGREPSILFEPFPLGTISRSTPGPLGSHLPT